MPGPSLPARKKKQRVVASKKSKSPMSSPSPSYEPLPDAPVRQLPPYIKYAWRVWWNDWIGDPFLSKKKNRGNKNGAKAWVREHFCGAWWEDNMPGVKASQQDKLWYFDHTKVGDQIYAYLHNSSVRGSKGRDPNGPCLSKITIKSKTAGHDFWRRENHDLYEEEVQKWKSQYKREPNFGELRKISGLAFKRRSQDEQDKWNNVAKETLKASQALATLTEPSDHAQTSYYDVYSQALDTLMADGEKSANIRICALVLHKKPDGSLTIDWKISEGLQEFVKSPTFAAATRALREWIKEASGENVENVVPEPVVQPSRKKRTRGKKGKGKRRTDAASDEESVTDSEPGSEVEEPDYGNLDKTHQDDDDEDSWLSPDESFGVLLPGTELLEHDGNNDLDVDQLELRRRYGFTWVNMLFESHGSDASQKKPLESWTHSDVVFGRFRDLPPYEPVSFHAPKALVARINAIAKSCKEAMDELSEYLGSNPRIPPKLAREARAQAEGYLEHQVLYEYILLYRAVWNNAARVAVNGIFGHGTYIALIVREAAEAQQMVKTAIEQGIFPDPDVGPTEVADVVRSANEAVAELQSTFKELCALQQLATKWYNELQGNWLYDKIPVDLPTLVRIVQGLLDWADETTELITRLRSDRKLFWEENVGEPFESKQTGSVVLYRFGCPSVMEEPVGLRDAFQAAQALLSSCRPLTPSMGPSEMLDDHIILGVSSGYVTSALSPKLREIIEAIPSVAGTPLSTLTALAVPDKLEIGRGSMLPLTPISTSPTWLPPTSIPTSSTSQRPTPSSKRVPIKRKRETKPPEAPPERVSARNTPTAAYVKHEPPRTRASTKPMGESVRYKRANEIGKELKNTRTTRRNVESKRARE